MEKKQLFNTNNSASFHFSLIVYFILAYSFLKGFLVLIHTHAYEAPSIRHANNMHTTQL